MFGMGGGELILVLVVALLVFGPKKLPELARGMGKAIREFRRASSDLREQIALDADLSEAVREVERAASGSEAWNEADRRLDGDQASAAPLPVGAVGASPTSPAPVLPPPSVGASPTASVLAEPAAAASTADLPRGTGRMPA